MGLEDMQGQSNCRIIQDVSIHGTGLKVMSKEFIEAEMALFLEQCKDVDIVISMVSPECHHVE